MDDYFYPGLHIDRYHMLENDLLRFLDYVSLEFYKSDSERERIKSVYLADLLLRIGSNIDIFFRKYITLSSESICTAIKNEKPDDRSWNWRDYKKLEDILYLSNKYVIIIPTNEKLYPFKGSGKLWQDITQRDKYWWNSYNKVKHNAEFEKANLDNVLQSLGALLILISYKSSISKLSYYRYVSVDPQFAQAVAEGQSSGGNVTYLITKLFIDPYFITY